MRRGVLPLIGLLLAAGCDNREPPASDRGSIEIATVGEGKLPRGVTVDAQGRWSLTSAPELTPKTLSAKSGMRGAATIRKRLIPTQNGICRFEERDPQRRPSGLIPTNRGSNMIFWADRGSGLWDHANGSIYDEGMVIPGKRIVAAREGMKDLWISPAVEGPIYLYSGPEIFECSRPSAR